jgi:hypothetical protein
MLQGHSTLVQHGNETTSVGTNSLVYRTTTGARILMSDANARENLFIEASALEHALEGMLDNRLRERLVFKPGVDWAIGLAASLRGRSIS